MIQHNQPFTDSHGITHAAPVFQLAHANLSHTSQQAINYQSTDDSFSESSSSFIRADYGMFYWTSQTAKDNGARPMKFVAADSQERFSFTLEAMPSSLAEACESHFTQEYLTDAE